LQSPTGYDLQTHQFSFAVTLGFLVANFGGLKDLCEAQTKAPMATVHNKFVEWERFFEERDCFATNLLTTTHAVHRLLMGEVFA
jgi:hypothetical protein